MRTNTQQKKYPEKCDQSGYYMKTSYVIFPTEKRGKKVLHVKHFYKLLTGNSLHESDNFRLSTVLETLSTETFFGTLDTGKNGLIQIEKFVWISYAFDELHHVRIADDK